MVISGNGAFLSFLFLHPRASAILQFNESAWVAPGRRSRTRQKPVMTKVLVLYYSSYGHIETMAGAVAEGAREGGAEVDIKRVPELVPDEAARASHYKLDQAAPVATAAELVAYDAIIVGVGTRYGRMAS